MDVVDPDVTFGTLKKPLHYHLWGEKNLEKGDHRKSKITLCDIYTFGRRKSSNVSLRCSGHVAAMLVTSSGKTEISKTGGDCVFNNTFH